jgi:hypothetical protein
MPCTPCRCRYHPPQAEAATQAAPGDQLQTLAAHLQLLAAPGVSQRLVGTPAVGILRSACDVVEELADQVGTSRSIFSRLQLCS